MSARVIGAIGSGLGIPLSALFFLLSLLPFGGTSSGLPAIMLLAAVPGFLGAFAPLEWRPRPWVLAAAATIYAGPLSWMFSEERITFETLWLNLPEIVLAYAPAILLAWAALSARREAADHPGEPALTRGPSG